MDKISNKGLPNSSSDKDALAQPLELKDSLRIRDGLGDHGVRPAGWLQYKLTRLTAFDLSAPWINNN